MCFTGQCPYEVGGGECAGNCKLPFGAPMPDDALCVVIDREIERDMRRENPLKWFWVYRLMQVSAVRNLHNWLFGLWWRHKYKGTTDEIPF